MDVNVKFKDVCYKISVDGTVKLITSDENKWEVVWSVMCENYPESVVEVWKETSF